MIQASLPRYHVLVQMLWDASKPWSMPWPWPSVSHGLSCIDLLDLATVVDNIKAWYPLRVELHDSLHGKQDNIIISLWFAFRQILVISLKWHILDLQGVLLRKALAQAEEAKEREGPSAICRRAFWQHNSTKQKSTFQGDHHTVSGMWSKLPDILIGWTVHFCKNGQDKPPVISLVYLPGCQASYSEASVTGAGCANRHVVCWVS